MNMIVCVKQIMDPEIPASVFKIDPEAKRAILPNNMKLVVSDYDKNAVEAALKLKEIHGGKITIVSLGSQSAIEAIRECIAMGADEGILLSDPLFDESNLYCTASALAQAIKKIGDFDLIFCGREEGDWDGGQVGSGIANFLSIPVATVVGKVQLKNGKVEVERVVADGCEIIELPIPALLTISSEIGTPRYPTVRRIMAARSKQLITWNAQDINIDPSTSRIKMLELFLVPKKEARCEFVEGETLEEAGTKLALKLGQAKLI